MGKFELREGHELRGMMIRIYPTKEDEECLMAIEDTTRTIWNWLVKQTEDVLAARAAWAVREGLVPPRPPPRSERCYDGMNPEESKASNETHRREAIEWHGKVHAVTKNVPGCSFRKFKDVLNHFGVKYDYQLFARYQRWKAEDRGGDTNPVGAGILQALGRNYFTKSGRRKKFRKGHDPMPIQTRTGQCFEEGAFGRRGCTHVDGGRPFYDCLVKIAGLKIKGRLPAKRPEGRVIEGVSITRRADGWWASIKVERPTRELSTPIPGTVVGIDVGLDFIAAIAEPREGVRHLHPSRGIRVPNPRAALYAALIASKQVEASVARVAGDHEKAKRIKERTARVQQRAARHTHHLIMNKIVIPLAMVETIKVENLQQHVGQMGSSKTSSMRAVYRALVLRYGPERVREVDCRFTSQDCSQCGFRSKETWSYEHGRIGECPSCGHREDRDLNAARNIASRPPISEAS